MRTYKNTSSGFTLIELIVAITIFGMIMISVMSIFVLSSQVSAKIELTRAMQENMKNALEDIAESVRKGDITDVTDIWGSCSSFTAWKQGNKLCLTAAEWDTEYTLWNKDTGVWLPLSNVADCVDNYAETADSICRILKKTSSWDFIPLTNNLIAFEGLEFSLHNTDIPRVTVRLTARPTYKKWVTPQLVKVSRVHIQTTLSERAIITQ